MLIVSRARRRGVVLAPALALAGLSGTARANGDPLTDVVSDAGGAGLGAALRLETSPYRGGGTRSDLIPLYLYEGKHQ